MIVQHSTDSLRQLLRGISSLSSVFSGNYLVMGHDYKVRLESNKSPVLGFIEEIQKKNESVNLIIREVNLSIDYEDGYQISTEKRIIPLLCKRKVISKNFVKKLWLIINNRILSSDDIFFYRFLGMRFSEIGLDENAIILIDNNDLNIIKDLSIDIKNKKLKSKYSELINNVDSNFYGYFLNYIKYVHFVYQNKLEIVPEQTDVFIKDLLFVIDKFVNIEFVIFAITNSILIAKFFHNMRYNDYELFDLAEIEYNESSLFDDLENIVIDTVYKFFSYFIILRETMNQCKKLSFHDYAENSGYFS
ncbi:MAG: hypothetical protein QXF12_02805 [Candidatus Aenigmatarchaeota archaeon]